MEHPLQIAVIGGGAAGFFAAIQAKRQMPQAEVTIYEKQKRPLAKVAITGGGRCNLTNSFAEVTDLRQVYPRGHQLMKRLFRQFSPSDAFAWFEREGVPLVVQDDECVFPQSQDSASIIWCLTSLARQLGVKLIADHKLTDIRQEEDGRWLMQFNNDSATERVVHRVAITTGGHPRQGSFDYLAALGHEIEKPVPSLFTFNIGDEALKQLMGTVVETATASIPGTKFKARGPLLITHWGMSGPAILKLSSHAARHLHDADYKVQVAVNWVDETNASVVEDCLNAIAQSNQQKQLSSVRPFGLPSRLWLHILRRTGNNPDRRWAEMGRKGVSRLVNALTNDTYPVTGRGTFKEEFVTCGGVALSGVNMNTLESKHVPNLFFAGEVLDVDALTGGFNLQAAWTTGFVVGNSIVRTHPCPPKGGI